MLALWSCLLSLLAALYRHYFHVAVHGLHRRVLAGAGRKADCHSHRAHRKRSLVSDIFISISSLSYGNVTLYYLPCDHVIGRTICLGGYSGLLLPAALAL